MKKSILIIDDDKNILKFLYDSLTERDFDVLTCLSGCEGIKLYKEKRPLFVVTDLRMSGTDGMGVIEQIIKVDASARIIMMTGYASVETAVQAMKKGARDYIVKPFEADDLISVIRHQSESDRVMEDLSKEQAPDGGIPKDIIFCSAAMKKVYTMASKVANTDATVLVQGESGVGKEVLACYIHDHSPRKSKGFVTVDCGSITETLLESELFGHKKGAFTGAVEDHIGLFESASGGTLFLDEISNMGLSLQAKLLRALQERVVKPVGSVREVPIDIRIIAATNKNLHWEMDEGRFRKDLYYRLDVISLVIPPLRERKEDIEVLVPYFVSRLEGKGLPRKDFSDEAIKLLMEYQWQGNIRELQNTIEKAVVLSDGASIQKEDLPANIIDESYKGDFKEKKGALIARFERKFIEEVLIKTKGNVSRAAEELGISRKSLHQKIKELDIKVD